MQTKFSISRNGKKIKEIVTHSAVNAAGLFGGKLIVSAPFCGVIEKDKTLFDIEW